MLKDTLSPATALTVLFCTIVWSCIAITIKMAVQWTDVSTFNVLRFVMVLPFLLVTPRPAIHWGRLILIAVCWNFLNFFFIGAALQAGLQPGSCMFIFQTNTLFVLLFSFVFLGEKAPKRSLTALGLGFLGLYLLLVNDLQSVPTWHGLLFAALSAIFWAVGFLVAKGTNCPDRAALNIWVGGISFVLFSLFELATHGTKNLAQLVSARHGIVIFGAVFAGLAGSVFVNNIWYKIIGRYTSGVLMPFMVCIPVFTLGLSIVWLDEPVTPQKGVACLLIIGALVVNQYGLGPFKKALGNTTQ